MAVESSGHQLALLQGGAEFFAALVQSIDRSVIEVRLETYMFYFDASGQQVAAALERAAFRGVSVYLVMDGVGTPPLPAEWAGRFKKAGVAWRIYSPLGRWGLLIPSRWRRLHRKLCVVDGVVAFCGGINVLDDFFDPNHGVLEFPRFDFAVRVEGPLVQTAHTTMAQLWWRLQALRKVRQGNLPTAWAAVRAAVRQALHPVSPPGLAPLARSAGSVHSATAELVLRDNLRNRTRIERAYRDAIGEARHEIIIANAYFLPGSKLRKSLIDAAQRGVRVRLLLHGRYEYFMQYHAARPVYDALLAAGVEIHEYSVSFLHAKVAVIDGRWATVGSSNLDPLSLLLAREANVVVSDTAFAAELRACLEQAFQSGGIPVDQARYASRPWHQLVLDRLAFGLMRALLFVSGKRY